MTRALNIELVAPKLELLELEPARRIHLHLAHRRELISNRGLMQVIDLLYWDHETGRPKRGSTTGERPGNLRRLIRVVAQLGLNYDLYGMTGPQIVELLPPEFTEWIK